MLHDKLLSGYSIIITKKAFSGVLSALFCFLQSVSQFHNVCVRSISHTTGKWSPFLCSVNQIASDQEGGKNDVDRPRLQIKISGPPRAALDTIPHIGGIAINMPSVLRLKMVDECVFQRELFISSLFLKLENIDQDTPKTKMIPYNILIRGMVCRPINLVPQAKLPNIGLYNAW